MIKENKYEETVFYCKTPQNFNKVINFSLTKYLTDISVYSIFQSIVTRNIIVRKLACGYCLCYYKTFSLVPDSTECTKIFLPKCAVHYLYHLKSNNIIGQSKTTNTEKHFYP